MTKQNSIKTDRELLQMAFKAMDSVNDFSSGSLYGGVFDYEVKTLRAALAQPERKWQGLTDEEIKDILDCGRPNLVNIKKAEQKLKEKNSG
jgi:hypothetical protein